MSEIPVLKSKEVIKALIKLGFANTRQKGSHAFFKHSDGRTTVVPVRSRKDIGKGLMKSILNDVKMSVEEFRKYL